MNAVHAELAQHGGALANHAANARASWSARQGVLLTLKDELGHVGFGEASPLPGYSPDTLAECWDALQRVPWTEARALLAAQEPLRGLAALDAFLPRALPAARFAAETALADLESQRCQLPLWAWLGSHSEAPTLELCHLLGQGRAEDVRLEAERLHAAGVRSFKLKVGRDYSAELRVLNTLRQRFGDGVRLRCDANQNFSRAAAQAFIEQALALELEFLEEPVASPELEHFSTSAVPLALDESLRDAPALFSSALAYPAVQVLVLKPMLLGGFSGCFAHIRAARPDQRLVFSHLFDGPVAWAATANAALAWGSPSLAAGLAPHTGLDVWPRATLRSCSLHDQNSRTTALASGFARTLAAAPDPGLGLSWAVAA